MAYRAKASRAFRFTCGRQEAVQLFGGLQVTVIAVDDPDLWLADAWRFYQPFQLYGGVHDGAEQREMVGLRPRLQMLLGIQVCVDLGAADVAKKRSAELSAKITLNDVSVILAAFLLPVHKRC